MSEVVSQIRERLEQLQYEQEPRPVRSVAVSMRLYEHEIIMLDRIAKVLKLQRTPTATLLLAGAIRDAARELGIDSRVNQEDFDGIRHEVEDEE